MPDNRKEWDALLEAEEARSRRKSVSELNDEGYEFYKQADYRHAVERFAAAAALAEEQGTLDAQCEDLYWEGSCWQCLGKLKRSLALLLRAEELGGGDAGVRFLLLEELFNVANSFPLSRQEQEVLLKKLVPYKGSLQIGGSKSKVLICEILLLDNRGDLRTALDRAQEAFASQVDRYPSYDDCKYYRELIDLYWRNGLLPQARKTLRDWQTHGSTKFAVTKSNQFLAEAQLYYAEGRLSAAWDAIRRCQAEEQYLHIYGDISATLYWLVRIGVDAGRLVEVRSVLPLLFRFHYSDSMYEQYDCAYWFAWYYAALAHTPQEKPALTRARAKRWYHRAERIGRELDTLLETDVKQKELAELREKLG